MEIMVKVCTDGEKSEDGMPEQPEMTLEEAQKRFVELVKGSIKLTDKERQMELQKVLGVLSGEGPEDD